MKTLDEFNAAQRQQYALNPRNGIACPKCGGELLDGAVILMSDPPQVPVFCECGYRGYRIA